MDFSNTVINAAAGQTAILHNLRGNQFDDLYRHKHRTTSNLLTLLTSSAAGARGRFSPVAQMNGFRVVLRLR